MPARAEEAKHAKDEGIQFLCLTNPVAFLGDDQGWLQGVRCLKMELGEPDASGRRSPVPVPGSEFELPIRMAVIALGTSANPLVQSTTPDLQTNRKGYIAADPETLRTSRAGRVRGRRHRHRLGHRHPGDGRRPQGRPLDRRVPGQGADVGVMARQAGSVRRQTDKGRGQTDNCQFAACAQCFGALRCAESGGRLTGLPSHGRTDSTEAARQPPPGVPGDASRFDTVLCACFLAG